MKYLPIKSKFIYVLLLILSLVNIINLNTYKLPSTYIAITQYIVVFTMFLQKSKMKNLILFVNLIVILPLLFVSFCFANGDILGISRKLIEIFFTFIFELIFSSL